MNQNYIDAVNLAGFILGIMNYQENLTQNDKQEIIEEFNNKLKLVLEKTNNHLKEQDRKLDLILEELRRLNK